MKAERKTCIEEKFQETIRGARYQYALVGEQVRVRVRLRDGRTSVWITTDDPVQLAHEDSREAKMMAMAVALVAFGSQLDLCLLPLSRLAAFVAASPIQLEPRPMLRGL